MPADRARSCQKIGFWPKATPIGTWRVESCPSPWPTKLQLVKAPGKRRNTSSDELLLNQGKRTSFLKQMEAKKHRSPAHEMCARRTWPRPAAAAATESVMSLRFDGEGGRGEGPCGSKGESPKKQRGTKITPKHKTWKESQKTRKSGTEASDASKASPALKGLK